MSAEKYSIIDDARSFEERYSSYTEAYREFRMNIAENDFHDDYPETAEMTLAITSGLRYHYIRNYRLLTADQTVQLIETFAKRCAKLEDYKDTLNQYLYGSESMIKHTHWLSNDTNLAFDEWILLCYAYGLITLTNDTQRYICMDFVNRNRWVKRNTIQLKLLDKDIKRRSELQQKLIDMGKLVNDIDKFNHIYKYVYVPTIDLQTGIQSYKYVIDSYYDGHVDERLGTDTIYEWILNDDINRFQQWYNDGGLREYDNAPHGKNKNLEYRKDIAAHILASNAAKIIRFIIMNNISEFIGSDDGRWSLMDPWIQPVNDPECFRLLQVRFMKEHERIVRGSIDNDNDIMDYTYRYIKQEIAEAIYNEISEILTRIYGTDNISHRLHVAIEMAKFGHIGPIESLDWETITKTLSDKDNYENNEYVILKLARLMESRHALLSKHNDCLPFGMNPSTAVYLHDLFSENGLVKIALREPFLFGCSCNTLGIKVNSENQIIMAEYDEDWEYTANMFDDLCM